jgi:ribulose 1,5-bisphosphate synthetase/thiazole synthase
MKLNDDELPDLSDLEAVCRRAFAAGAKIINNIQIED